MNSWCSNLWGFVVDPSCWNIQITTRNTCRSERPPSFSPKMGLFQWAKYSPVIESNYNLALIRANTVPAGLDPRTEMGSIVGWNSNILLIELLWCPNGFRWGWVRLWPLGLNWHFGAETDHLKFSVKWRVLMFFFRNREVWRSTQYEASLLSRWLSRWLSYQWW